MKIKLPVKQLVEFLLRSGSIDTRFFGGPIRAQLGSWVHRMLEKEGGDSYSSEVSLSGDFTCGDIEYTIYGRADGIIRTDDMVMIDEIKSTSEKLSDMDENHHEEHWGQGICYGCILAQNEKLSQVSIRLTYYQIDTNEIRRFVRTYTADQLNEYVLELLEKYRKWAELTLNWKVERDESLKNLTFPFNKYRRGQRSLAVAAYRAIEREQRLFACAPTGVGKTISVLFSSLKAMGEGMGEKIFYLTAKTIARSVAEGTVQKLHSSYDGLKLKSLTITAKDKVCFMSERRCDPENCPYALNYFDRSRDAVYTMLQGDSVFTRSNIELFAKEMQLCPYELTLDLSLWCDVIICDYNYLFDPQASLQRYFENKKGDYIFLIDEAHNLVDRARDMYSAHLDKQQIFDLRKIIDKKEKKLRSSLSKLNKVFIELRKRCKEKEDGIIVQKEHITEFEAPLSEFIKRCTEYFTEKRGLEIEDELLDVFFQAKFFASILADYDDAYISLIYDRLDNVSVRLYCADPSSRVDKCLSKGRGAVLFSATLLPLSYYAKLLGNSDDAKLIEVDSPFSQDKMGLFIADRISTKYQDRDTSFPQVLETIHTFVISRDGNYMVFLPSYSYMEKVADAFEADYPELNIIRQEIGMTEDKRKAFLEKFTPDGNTIAFCVLGGIYGEGIDLVGDRLIGTAIVGVGIPQISVELDVLRDYFKDHGMDGFAYAYQYPGMNKVLQAAGRVIRSENDRGVVLLIDSRFTLPRYLQLTPRHWSHFRRVKNAEQLQEYLLKFWETNT